MRGLVLCLLAIAVLSCHAETCNESYSYTSSDETGDLGCDSYTDGITVSWFISVDESERILLSFDSFDTESNYDFVTVFDGPTMDYPSLGSFSGSLIPGPFRSSSNTMYVVFTSDISFSGDGFSGHWSAFQLEEGITACSESISDPVQLDGSEGSFGCNGYGNNVHISWHITGNEGEKVVLTFETFNTEAQYDFVTVYDGGNQNAELIGQFSGTSLPTPITASGNELFIELDSDYSLNKSGFTASWSSFVQFVDPCYNSTNKVLITYEGYLGCEFGYGNFVQSSWLITLVGDYIIQLDFLTFDLEDVYDWVTVYDGLTTTAPLLGSFSGSDLPPRIVSSRNHLLVTFLSDAAVTGNGFTAAYQSAHALQPGGCSRSGTFVVTAPEDSIGCDGYLDGVREEWHILAQNSHQVINLVWHLCDLERDSDFIYIYDGNSTSDPLIATLTGGALPDPTTSTGPALLVVFEADNDNSQGEGFRAIYQSIVVNDDIDDSDCSGTQSNVLTDDRGSFGCQGYSNNAQISWQIHVEDNYSILMHFTSFFTEALADTIIIYDGPDEDSYPIGSFSGALRPPPVASSSSYLYIVFSSDSQTTRSGFTAEYEALFSGNDAGYCDSSAANVLYDDPGTFGCSGYADGITVSWAITVAAGNLVSVDFVHFETEIGFDFVIIYDGPSADYPVIDTFSGPSIPPVVTSTSNQIFVRFSSDSDTNYPGFTANYHSIEDPGDISSCTSTTHRTLSDPAGQFGCNGYSNSIDPTWLITADSGKRITLHFDSLNTEPFYDYVEIFDGSNEAATSLGTYSGAAAPEIAISSSSENMYVLFHADTSNSGEGFVLQYASFGSFLGRCDHSADYELDGPIGTFGCDSYSSSVTVTWTISSFASIFVNFETFDTEPNYDVVSVYDGSDSNSPLIATFSGSDAHPVFSSGTYMHVVFSSDASVTRTGFTANFATAMYD